MLVDSIEKMISLVCPGKIGWTPKVVTCWCAVQKQYRSAGS